MENFPEYLKGLRLETKLSYREVASRAGYLGSLSVANRTWTERDSRS